MVTIADLTIADAELLEREICKRSFVEFLSYVTILTDDPHNPGAIPFVPYSYQVERAEAWEAHESEVILKARQLGFSWLVAAYMYWRAAYHGWAVGYYSRAEDEAKHQLEQRVLFIHQKLAAHLSVAYRKVDTLVQFDSGGSIRVFPSTESAGIGYTFQLIVADESAFHAYGAQNYAAYQPTLSAGGQYLAISTADPSLGPAGFFYDLYWGAVRGENGYRAVFIPWHARPGRDAEWYERARAAYVGLPESFDAFYPDTDAAAFVGRSGLVYPMFDQSRHVRDGDPVPWEACVARYAGYDCGGGDPTAIVILGLYRGSDGMKRVHQYAEYVKRAGAPSVEEMYAWLAPWHERGKFAWIEGDPAPAGEVVMESLRGLGLPVRKAQNKRDEGLGLVAQYLDRGWLTINAACRWGIEEFAGYRWMTRVDPSSKQRYATATPHDHHGDCMDSRRYALMGLYYDEMTRRDHTRPAYEGVRL